MLIGKWIKGYEGTHSVTSDGKVYRYKNDTAIEVSQCKHTAGYLYCTLTRNGKSTNYLIHRLVAETFIPNLENKKYVNHKDGNKHNNLMENLEWVTATENTLHAYTNGLNSHCRSIGQYDLEGNLIAVYNSQREAQIAMGRPKGTNINCMLTQKRCKTAYGYVWRYLNEEPETL